MPETGEELRACADALQSAQKRSRTAFLLSTFASGVVLLTVFNLSAWARRGAPALTADAPLNIQEMMKEHIKHAVDQSYYQLPLLGIQITCEDVGLFGPFALLIFSLHSLMAFRALNSHVSCLLSSQFAKNRLISTLLDTELLPGSSVTDKGDYLCSPSRLVVVLLYLPCAASVVALGYGVYSYFVVPYYDSHPMYQILSMQEMIRSIIFEMLGAFFTLISLSYNRRTVRLFNNTHCATRKVVKVTDSRDSGLNATAAATV